MANIPFLNNAYFTAKVGIGTSNPGSKLTVAGDVLIDSGEYISWGTVGATSIEGSTASNKLQFRTNSADRMIINDTGVGIGTTSPNSKLDVRRSGNGVALELIQTSGSANDYIDLKMIAGNTTAGTFGTILRHKRDGSGGGDFSILTNPTLSGTPTEKLIVKSGGNVGIGTTSPNYKLEVQGVISSADAGLQKATFANVGNDLVLTANADATNVTAKMLFNSSGAGGTAVSTKMIIDGFGNVGIGTTSPTARLDILTNSATGNNDIDKYVRFRADNGEQRFAFNVGRSGNNSALQMYDSSEVQKVNIASGGTSYLNGGNVGIGTTSPTGKLDVVGSLVTTRVLTTGSLSLIGTDATASAQTVLTISTGVGNATGPNIVLSKSRSQSSGAVVANDPLGTIQFQGGNGTASVEGARIAAIAGSTWSSTNRDSDLLFWTTPSGSTTIAERMRINSAGNVGIGTTAPSQKLHISGNMRLTGAFRDGLNSQGAANYVLTSTGSNGTRWVDASGSSIIGGPYLPLAGGTMTGNIVMSDNDITGIDQLTFTSGTYLTDVSSNYIELHYASAASGGIIVIDGDGTTQGYLYADGQATSSFGLLDGSGSWAVKCAEDAEVELRYDNVKKFETTNTGVTVTGDVEIRSGNKLILQRPNNGVATEISTDSTGAMILNSINDEGFFFNNNGTNAFKLDPINATFAGTVSVGTNNSIFAENNLRFKSAGAAFIDHNTVSQSIKFRLSNSSSLDVTPLEVTPLYLSSTVDMYFGDNDKIRLGASSDLQIYHDGSNSYIQDTSGTGDLIIDTSTFRLRSANGGETMIRAFEDGAAILSHNNLDKLATTSTGVTVTGAATATTFLGDLNGTINTVTTAVTKANATNDTTVATTAFVQNLIGTIPAGLVFQGTWNAATNTPTLTSGSGTTGHFYIVSTSGSTNLDGVTDWVTGDWAVFIEQGGTDAWEKIDNSSVLDGAGTGQTVALWSGSGTSNTLTDAPITVSGNDTTFAGDLKISKSTPKLIFDNLAGGGLDPSLTASGTNFTLSTASITPLSIALDTGNATFSGDVSMTNGNATGKFAVKSSAVHGSYDFYNNGTSYLNGAVIVDAAFTQSGGSASTFSGNVGIGATSPSQKLHVDGNTLISAEKYYYVAGGGAGFGSDASGNIKIRQNGADLIFGSGNNVGIGTTSPGVKLEVVDSTNAQLEVSGYSLETSTANAANGTIFMGNNSSYRGVIDYNASSTGDLIISNTYNNATSGIRFKVSTSDAGGITAMKIKGNGNVGIGTTNPLNKLFVSASTAGDYAGFIENTNSTNGYGLLARTAHTGTSGYAFAARAGASDIFVVRGDGNVGIGTTSPSGILHVKGSTDDTVVYIDTNNNAIGDSAKISFNDRAQVGWIDAAVTLTDGGGNKDIKLKVATGSVFVQTNNTTRLTVADGGNVGIGTTSPGRKLTIGNANGFVNNQISLLDGGGTEQATIAVETTTANDLLVASKANLRFFTGSTIGASTTLPTNEKMRITSAGGISFGSTGTAYGTAGQVLTSAGNASPTWTTPSSGGGIGGSIASTQLALGSGTANEIQGSSLLTLTNVSSGSGANDMLRIGNGTTGENQVLLDINTKGTATSRGRLTLSDAGTVRGFLGITGGDQEVTLLSNANLVLSGGGKISIDGGSTNDVVIASASGSNVGIGNTSPDEKLDVTGRIKASKGVQVGTEADGDAASGLVGTFRYRLVNGSSTAGTNYSFVDMCMQTGTTGGLTSYEWVNIVTNRW